MSAALLRPVPVSTSPLLGAPSTVDTEVSDEDKFFLKIQESIKKCKLTMSFRNPFQLSKSEKTLFEIKETSNSGSHLEITYKTSENSYFAYLLGKEKYSSKIYLKGESSGVLSETLFYPSTKEESPLFKSMSNTFSVVCSKINEEDIKEFIEKSKFKEKFDELSLDEQTLLCRAHLTELEGVVFKIKELFMRLPL